MPNDFRTVKEDEASKKSVVDPDPKLGRIRIILPDPADPDW
jgi:hypothetical protein